MPKRYNIKWRESDFAEVRRVVKNYNAKLNRLKDREDLVDYLPDKITAKEIIENTKTRQALNLQLNKLQRFTRRGSEEIFTNAQGVTDIRYNANEFAIFKRSENVAKKKKKEFLENQDVTQGGESTGIKRVQMGKIKEVNLEPITQTVSEMNQREWDKMKSLMNKKLLRRANNEDARQALRNYVKGLIKEGYSDDIIEMLRHVDIDEFADVLDMDVFAEFDFIYGLEELKAKEEALISTWEKYITNTEHSYIDVEEIIDEVYQEDSYSGL